MNAVASYIDANHSSLGLERFGVGRRPSCVLLTPRFSRSRHVIVLALPDERGKAGLVAKLPRLLRDGAGLAREARNLLAVESALGPLSAGTVPTVVAFEPAQPVPLLLESALSGRPLSPAALRRDRRGAAERVAGWLERLAAETAARPGDEGWYERLVSRPLRELAARADAATARLAELTLERAERLRDGRIPLVFEHGDLCHPNLLLASDGHVRVLDWERAEPAGLPLHDLFFFLAYAAAAGRRDPDAVGGAFFGRRAWAWRLAERYALRLDIDSGLLEPLLAVHCARTVAAGGAARRHMCLWRLAVEKAGP